MIIVITSLYQSSSNIKKTTLVSGCEKGGKYYIMGKKKGVIARDLGEMGIQSGCEKGSIYILKCTNYVIQKQNKNRQNTSNTTTCLISLKS